MTQLTPKDRILVTGASGFLGGHLVKALQKRGLNVTGIGHYKPPEFDSWYLCGLPNNVEFNRDSVELLSQNAFPAYLHSYGPFQYVFHLAGHNGGLVFQKNSFDIFHNNSSMAINVLKGCLNHGVKKVISVVASCAYPEFDYTLFDEGYHGRLYKLELRKCMYEEDLYEGTPHDSVAGHGYAKRNLQLACKFAKQQYGLNAVCACLTTLYGPEDCFDLERTKVAGALVKQFVDAADSNQESVTLMGSGAARREFLYVEDAAELLIRTAQQYDDSSIPLNLGTGQELTIRELAEKIAVLTGFTGRIEWTKENDGQLRKRLDLTRMKASLGEFTPTPLEEGLKRTIEYYRSARGEKNVI